jgi:thiamine monophosphate kinase
MTTDLEEQLSAGMREHTAGLALSGDVLGRATRNHRRRAATVRAGYALGVAGLAGVLAASLTLGGGRGANDPAPKAAPPSVAQAQSPSLRLAAAAAASDDISYRIRLSSGLSTRARSTRGPTPGTSAAPRRPACSPSC